MTASMDDGAVRQYKVATDLSKRKGWLPRVLVAIIIGLLVLQGYWVFSALYSPFDEAEQLLSEIVPPLNSAEIKPAPTVTDDSIHNAETQGAHLSEKTSITPTPVTDLTDTSDANTTGQQNLQSVYQTLGLCDADSDENCALDANTDASNVADRVDANTETVNVTHDVTEKGIMSEESAGCQLGFEHCHKP